MSLFSVIAGVRGFVGIKDKSGNIVDTENIGGARHFLVKVVESGNAAAVKTMDCLTGVAVDDLVFQLSSVDNTAIKAVNNTAVEPIVGIVTSKPTSITCVVQVSGILNKTEPRGRLWVSTSGTLTSTPPVTGYVQEMGWSCGNGKVKLNPVVPRILRS